MSLLYVSENGAVIQSQANRIVVNAKDGVSRSIPVETLEGITLLAPAQLTTQCMETCMKKGIDVVFFSKGGHYFGRLTATGYQKAGLQRRQAKLYHSDFAIDLSRRMVAAKLNNQAVMLRRYARNHAVDVNREVMHIQWAKERAASEQAIPEIMGYEGHGAKSYFKGLSRCVDSDFAFSGRSRRPPRDPFNALISLGYAILLNELYGEIESHGLNPYFGFMHQDAEKHPTLASDLMEEWRAVLVDSLAMSLLNGHELAVGDFESDDAGGCYLTKKGLAVFLNKMEKKMQTSIRYLHYLDYPVTFRRALGFQAGRLAKAIEAEDAALYDPILIR